MTQRRSRRLFSQTENSYESRIQYLEEVVHILVAGSNSTCFPLFSTTPLAGSFRYSIKRGLEPVLPDKTAISLAADWRIGRPIRRKCFSSPPRSQNRLITTCDTSLHPARVPLPTPPNSLTNPASPTTIGVADSANTAKSSPTSDLANKPTDFSPLDSPRPSSISASPTELPGPQPVSHRSPSARKTVCTTSNPSSPQNWPTAIHSINTIAVRPKIVAQTQEPTQIDHPINIFLPAKSSMCLLDNRTADISPALPSKTNQNKGPSPFPPSPSSSSAHLPTTATVIESRDQSLTPSVVNGPAPTTKYYNDIDNCLKLSGVNETKKKKKKKKTINSKSNSSTTSLAQPVDTLNTPEKVLPSPHVDVPTAVVGSLTVMDEETLAAFKRQNDPRYRPIEDSEFVPFEDW
ncbi:uncharacterized protein PGTG_20038 [Puccinia graminis f. sp. tritici CRL 75-36-700-3]|uniref:Uncharacterized protein n=1 Tax=Puccinia graminis f. sp. tritici (strain CRL 75-36-700-3 / race SCCL) TaxID=418459 RepID=E3LBX7_PUCGT|nr:uncharacterized protein PGTG_20038 [Puccinia graminis f. sp. tritici CRL 75-36-700-3]EFP94052.1 hypothetical protein PGTG_20038 [Puccinia graminis f. sp. tritici CRL 75-36-700-3]